MEFLIGRSLLNAMVNLGMDSELAEALTEVCVCVCVCVCVHVSIKDQLCALKFEHCNFNSCVQNVNCMSTTQIANESTVGDNMTTLCVFYHVII